MTNSYNADDRYPCNDCGDVAGIDWKQACEREAEKFHVETGTTSFLAERLRNANGAAVLCDRCKSNYGKAVLVGPNQTREWLCPRCLGEPEQRGRAEFLHATTATENKEQRYGVNR